MAESVSKEGLDRSSTLFLVGRDKPPQAFVILGNDDCELQVGANLETKLFSSNAENKNKQHCCDALEQLDVETKFDDIMIPFNLFSKSGIRESFRVAKHHGELFSKWQESGEPLTNIRFFHHKNELHQIESDHISCDIFPNESIGITMVIENTDKSIFEVWHCDKENKPDFPLYRIPLSKCQQSRFYPKEKLRDDILISFEVTKASENKVIIRAFYDIKTAENIFIQTNSKQNNKFTSTNGKSNSLAKLFTIIWFLRLRLLSHNLIRVGKVSILLLLISSLAFNFFYLSSRNKPIELLKDEGQSSNNLEVPVKEKIEDQQPYENGTILANVNVKSEVKTINQNRGSHLITKLVKKSTKKSTFKSNNQHKTSDNGTLFSDEDENRERITQTDCVDVTNKDGEISSVKNIGANSEVALSIGIPSDNINCSPEKDKK